MCAFWLGAVRWRSEQLILIKTKIEMALKQEILEEGWVKFTRWHCKEGYLDRWMGDCINNPNNPKKSQWQLNSFASYWRCNSGEWISDRDLGRSEVFALLQMGEEFTAKEIWDELLKRVAAVISSTDNLK